MPLVPVERADVARYVDRLVLRPQAVHDPDEPARWLEHHAGPVGTERRAIDISR